MGGHAIWFTLPFLVLAAGQLEPGLSDLGRPRAIPTLADELPTDTADAVPLGSLDPASIAHCEAHCVADWAPGSIHDAWILWDGTATAGFQAAIFSGGGAASPDGSWILGIPAFDGVLIPDAPSSGRLHVWGSGEFMVAAHTGADDVPNLAAMVPADLGLIPDPSDPSAQGCLPAERVEGATSCFRFASGLANTGMHELHVSALTGLAADAPVTLTQILPGGNQEVGEAQYHASHGHFHYDGLITFELHAFDPESGLRGDEVLAKAKTGFCMVDWGLQLDPGANTPQKSFWRIECEPESRVLRMGISPGWYDLYSATLPEQFIDGAVLVDGSYELIQTIDPQETLVEAHRLDNRASVRFTVLGGDVEVLEGRGLFHR